MLQVSRPFLKWPGGKFRLLKPILSQLPSCEQYTLIEPFVGAGALFLNTSYHKVIINDLNPDLINLYQQLKDDHASFIHDAKLLFVPKSNCSKQYYRIRRLFNQCTCPRKKAIYFIYLNRHGYNGLCRYNLSGFYNVPFGDYLKPYFPEKELLHAAKRLKKTTLYCLDYQVLLNKYLRQSVQNKLFYCDPPYAPLSKTANFTGYAAQKFTLEDQQSLMSYAKKLADKGATVLISNHDTPFTRELYRQAKIVTLQAQRHISCKALRPKVNEIIACFGG